MAVATFLASRDMAAEGRGAAALDRRHDLELGEVHVTLDKRELPLESRRVLLEALASVDSVLGVLERPRAEPDEQIDELVRRRDEARESRDFAEADRVRDELLAMGIQLEDTAQGTVWKRKL